MFGSVEKNTRHAGLLRIYPLHSAVCDPASAPLRAEAEVSSSSTINNPMGKNWRI